MANPEHVALIRANGSELRTLPHPAKTIPYDLTGENFDGMDLTGVHFQAARLTNTSFRGTKFSEASLSNACFLNADLSDAKFERADLSLAHLELATCVATSFIGARLTHAKCREAVFRKANLSHIDASQTDFRNCDFSDGQFNFTRFWMADLSHATATGAVFNGVDFHRVIMTGTNFTGAAIFDSRFSETDLTEILGLDALRSCGRNSIGYETLLNSCGAIPEKFLQESGMPQWMRGVSNLCNPALNSFEVSNLLYDQISNPRTDSPLFLGGAFISHSSVDNKFANKLYNALQSTGMAVTMDVPDFVAGGLESQVFKAIRRNNVVIPILSTASIESDWVWAEIREARKREKAEGRKILCPVRIDDAWSNCEHHKVEIGYLSDRLILDFSKPKKFQETFNKLIQGIKTEFGPRGPSQ